jgi:hypothetical protein
MLNVVMLSVANKPSMLSVVMLNVLMLSVIMPSVVGPFLGPAYQSNLGFTLDWRPLGGSTRVVFRIDCNIRLGLKRLSVTNTLAYFGTDCNVLWLKL